MDEISASIISDRMEAEEDREYDDLILDQTQVYIQYIGQKGGRGYIENTMILF